MKKIFTLLLVLCMVLSLAACGQDPAPGQTHTQPEAPADPQTETPADHLWPTTKNIKWLIGASAGGATDLNTKALTSKADSYIDANIVLEYVNGGGGTVMQTQLMDEASDGSVIATLAVGSALVKPWTQDLSYSVDDFTYIAGYTVTQSFLAVNSDFPADTFEEFVAECKANPGKYTYSQGSVGGIGHVQTAVMLADSGILEDTVMLSYDSGGEAVLALVGGHVDFTVASPAEIAQYVEEGSMKLLCLGGSSRSELYPDVPCAAELGITAIDSRGVICAPGGMDEDLANAISDMIRQWLDDADVQEAFNSMGQAIQYVDHEAITKECRQLYETCGEVLPKLGFTVVR